MTYTRPLSHVIKFMRYIPMQAVEGEKRSVCMRIERTGRARTCNGRCITREHLLVAERVGVRFY